MAQTRKTFRFYLSCLEIGLTFCHLGDAPENTGTPLIRYTQTEVSNHAW